MTDPRTLLAETTSALVDPAASRSLSNRRRASQLARTSNHPRTARKPVSVALSMPSGMPQPKPDPHPADQTDQEPT